MMLFHQTKSLRFCVCCNLTIRTPAVCEGFSMFDGISDELDSEIKIKYI